MRTASVNGMTCFLIGTFYAVVMAAQHNIPLAAVGLLAAGAGAIELHGLGRLRQGDPGGMNSLLLAQPLMLAVILGYCVLRVTHFEMPTTSEWLMEQATLTAKELEITVEEYFRVVNRLSMQILAIVGVVYQGLMLRYYLRRREEVRRALEEYWGEREDSGAGRD